MCTADIAGLAPGEHRWACLLSAKGRVLSVFDALLGEEELLLLCQPGQAKATSELLSSHAIMDEVEFEVGAMEVHRVWETPAAVWTAPPVTGRPTTPSSVEDVEIRRVEAGFPLMGVDVDDKRFPFESGLAAFLDHQKGCYVGQEPVARVRDRGQAQRELRGLALPEGAGAQPGESVVFGEKEVGTVTSVAASPDFGHIALGYLHRSACAVGAEVLVNGRPAIVKDLPFT